MWLWISLALVALVLALFYHSNTCHYGIFSSAGVPEPPRRFPFGTLDSSWKVRMGMVSFRYALNELYRKHKRECPYLGTFIFSRPVLVINDLDVAKKVLISDFNHFTDRRYVDIYWGKKTNQLSKYMLPNLTGEKWKRVRSILSSAFTSGRLKSMMPLFLRVGDDLEDHLLRLAKRNEDFDAKQVMMSYTVDCIASAGWSMEAKSFAEPDGTFRTMIVRVTGGSKPSRQQMLIHLMQLAIPKLAKILNLSIRDKESTLFFANIIKKSMKHRETEGTRRNDLIDIIKDAVEKQEEKDKKLAEGKGHFEKEMQAKFTKEEFEMIIVANTLDLFLTGFSTTSTTLSICLGFLCKNLEIQKKLVLEIREAICKNGGQDLDYNQVLELPYLDMVILETLRFYFTNVLERECVKCYKLPESDFVVPKGMLVQIPSMAIQRDEAFYPDPDNFNPDANFSLESKASRSPYAFLAFGQGPRNCIGMRLAFVIIKVALIKIFSNFDIISGSEMPKEIVMDPKSKTSQPKGIIWCKVKQKNG